ncbi:conserved membrane hypothetical protein [uncultured Eubacteriales bacterium]|uniref:ABC-transporter type IV n=1 Tax=uncultured Eubacteriales bacterium TaxID=172733 RepID=A0A212JLE7_9FIRM|nr:conserved membrane hypothetical protein [uncultured Eubacteriales bacterium]
MTEPVLFGFPISLLFLYFIVYAFLGWVMETCYCSILQRRFVARGFLYGPLCPIYGVGVLMMICWFAPFMGNPLLFYVVATVCMSAWEYLVGWFLETTTHIKYWDYSRFRFNLHGRICLQICLTWGGLAYIVIFWVHPFVSGLLALLSVTTQHVFAIVFLVLLVGDTAATIRELALVRRMMTLLNETGDELRLQLALGKAELSDYLEEAKDSLGDRLGDVKSAISDRLDDAKGSISEKLSIPSEATEKLRAKYDELLAKAERSSRHLRYVYGDMSSKKLSSSLSAVAEAGRKYIAEHDTKRAAKRAARKEKKNKSN